MRWGRVLAGLVAVYLGVMAIGPASASAQTAAPGYWDSLTTVQRQTLVNTWMGFQGEFYEPYMDSYPDNAADAVRRFMLREGPKLTGEAADQLADAQMDALLRAKVMAVPRVPLPTRIGYVGASSVTSLAAQVLIGALATRVFSKVTTPLRWSSAGVYTQAGITFHLNEALAPDGTYQYQPCWATTGGQFEPCPPADWRFPQSVPPVVDPYYSIEVLMQPTPAAQFNLGGWYAQGPTLNQCTARESPFYDWLVGDGLRSSYVVFSHLTDTCVPAPGAPPENVHAWAAAMPATDTQMAPLSAVAYSGTNATDVEQAPVTASTWANNSLDATELLEVEAALEVLYDSAAGEQLRTITQDAWSEAVTVPMVDCRGMVIAVCENALVDAGLQVGNVVVWDAAGANLAWGANEVTWTNPWPPHFTPQVEIGTQVDIWVNPNVMPVEVPEPLPGEHYQAYLDRLADLGLLGRTEVDTAADPALAPGTVTTVAPEPWTQVLPGTEILVRHQIVPSTGTAVAVRSCVKCSQGPLASPDPGDVDFTPLKIEGACDTFPFGLPCWTFEVVSAMASAQTPPSWRLPIGGSSGCGSCGITIDFGDFDPAMAVIRPVLLLLGTVGIVWAFGSLVTGRSIMGRGGGGGGDD